MAIKLSIVLLAALAVVAGCRGGGGGVGGTRTAPSASAPGATLLIDRAAVRPGQPFAVAVRLALEPGWHTYWINPGDAGMPGRVAWNVPAGVTVGPLVWPAPRRIEEEGVVAFGYTGEVWAVAEAVIADPAAAEGAVALSAQVDWLVCRETCEPRSAGVVAEVRVSSQDAETPAPADWAGVRALLPVADDRWRFAATADRDGRVLWLTVRPPDGIAAAVVTAAQFFPDARGAFDLTRIQAWQVEGRQVKLALIRDAVPLPEGPLRGVLAWPAAQPGLPRALQVAAGGPSPVMEPNNR